MRTHTINTNVGTAMATAAMHSIIKGSNNPLIMKIVDSVDKMVIKRNDWNASLSFKTAQKLKKEGVMV